jgi:hypothetical protein
MVVGPRDPLAPFSRGQCKCIQTGAKRCDQVLPLLLQLFEVFEDRDERAHGLLPVSFFLHSTINPSCCCKVRLSSMCQFSTIRPSAMR